MSCKNCEYYELCLKNQVPCIPKIRLLIKEHEAKHLNDYLCADLIAGIKEVLK